MQTTFITKEEYSSRLQRVQTLMQGRKLDALLVFSWKRGQIKYLTGYDPNYVANVALALVPVEGKAQLFIRFPFDLERAQRMTGMRDIRASGSLENLARDTAAEIRMSGFDRGSIGLVGGDRSMEELPFTLVENLRNLLPEASFSIQNDLFVDLRLRKSDAEFDALRKSARLADFGLQTAQNEIKANMTELQLIAAVEHALRANGANHHLAVIAAPGSRKLIGPPQERVIDAGEDVIIEIAVEMNGYWSQVAGVVFSTAPTAAQRKIVTAAYQAYQYSLEILKPGRRCAEVALEMQKFLANKGFKEYIEQDFGHGIGLDLPEPPKLEFDDDTLLEEGMVIVVHPAIRVPGVGGAFIGGTVLITQSGPEPLHDLSCLKKNLEV